MITDELVPTTTSILSNGSKFNVVSVYNVFEEDGTVV